DFGMELTEPPLTDGEARRPRLPVLDRHRSVVIDDRAAVEHDPQSVLPGPVSPVQVLIAIGQLLLVVTPDLLEEAPLDRAVGAVQMRPTGLLPVDALEVELDSALQPFHERRDPDVP